MTSDFLTQVIGTGLIVAAVIAVGLLIIRRHQASGRPTPNDGDEV